MHSRGVRRKDCAWQRHRTKNVHIRLCSRWKYKIGRNLFENGQTNCWQLFAGIQWINIRIWIDWFWYNIHDLGSHNNIFDWRRVHYIRFEFKWKSSWGPRTYAAFVWAYFCFNWTWKIWSGEKWLRSKISYQDVIFGNI